VEKHNYYAFYHQSAQAIASYLIDLPYKIINMIVFNLTIYFMGNLNRRPGNFFFFCLTTTLTTFTQSAIFRTLACLTRTPEQAMVPTALLTLGLIVYPGYTMPTAYMPGWSRWMNYVNPIAYSFEALMVNEFHGREYPCVAMVPQGNGYDDVPPTSQICSVVGATPGSAFVSGDNYINSSFGYYNSHKWRYIFWRCRID
jgi:ATP-binding cassette subfamily G (WHITE) protein 2 (PDR)